MMTEQANNGGGEGVAAADSALVQVETPPMSEEPSEQFVNWVVRKVLEARAYKVHVETYAAAEIRRAEAEEKYFSEKYAPQLRAWVQQQIAKIKGRRKRIRLPAGAIGFRTEPTHLDISDSVAVVKWCLVHLPQAVNLAAEIPGEKTADFQAWQKKHCPDVTVGERLLKSVLAEHIKETGEVPPAVTVGGGCERLFIK